MVTSGSTASTIVFATASRSRRTGSGRAPAAELANRRPVQAYTRLDRSRERQRARRRRRRDGKQMAYVEAGGRFLGQLRGTDSPVGLEHVAHLGPGGVHVVLLVALHDV